MNQPQLDTPPRVSLIVPNRGRLEELAQLLRALSYQNHPNFELLIITDQPEAVARLSHADRAQIFTCQSANIATARNIGLAHAAGEIIAFCDDDALPEPTWLARLIAPFAQDNLGAVSGPVIGRNGVSQQWGLCEIGDDGADTRLPEPQDTRIFAPKRPRAIKTAGTNCAFARAVFDQLGGFDEAFHYYLDEADVNLRLNASTFRTAYVPDARVMHGYAASAQRRQNRAPKSLFEIGASHAVFLRKHLDKTARPAATTSFQTAQRKRLIALMTIGLIEPRDIAPLMTTLAAGIEAGNTRDFNKTTLTPNANDFRPFNTAKTKPEHRILRARLFTRARRHREAKALAAKGHPVTVIEVLPSARALTRRFTKNGYWLSRVGQFGPLERRAPQLYARSNAATFRAEAAAITRFRTKKDQIAE